ncbi:unnamed protein product [Tuber aestivum]|uniref:Uncharacterized protein n=1 Tax=Tuber aestivum TaxID=59557 RepID=A0A292Q9E5_9PEZI|nr:unnamed protein product [Tuber aestivum]
MPYHHILPKRFDGRPTLPNSNSVGESLIEGSKKRPLKPFNSKNQSHRNIVVLVQRFFLTSFSLASLVVSLWAFSRIHQLSKWEQRSFNTLSILLTAIASLGLGSLLGHLGSMLRWPLLARTMYQMQDVDSILGMSPPAGSMRLIKRHIREWRISRTTFIVTAYLVANLFGRLSVAVFGLAYNMTDETGIRYPILATDWTSALWTGKIFPGGDGDTNTETGDSGSQFKLGDDISPYLESDLQVRNATLKVGKNTVEYSYDLKDFNGGYTTPSNRTVHSTVNCSLIQVGDGQYWRWGNGNRTGPFSWGEEGSLEVVSEILRFSNQTDTVQFAMTDWVSFLDFLGGSGVYPQIYIVCEEVAWECWPTLTETVGGNESQHVPPHERIFHPTELYRLLTVGSGDYEDFTEGNGGHYVYMNVFGRTLNRPSADDGAIALCSHLFGNSPRDEVARKSYALWVSGLVARLPILAIIHANNDLPKYARGPHPNQTTGTAYLHTNLEVNWARVVLIAVGITGGQILAILAVLGYCRGVYTRDDSHLATAEILKTVINRFDDGKLMTGEELATSLDDVLKEPVRYGTREGPDGGPPEVDLASGLDTKFPSFPKKRRLRRNIDLRVPES